MTVTLVLRLFPVRCERFPLRELAARVLGRPVERERFEREVDRERFDCELCDELLRLRDFEPPPPADAFRAVDDERRDEVVRREAERERLPAERWLLDADRRLEPAERERLRPEFERLLVERDRLRFALDALRRPVLRERVPRLRRELDLRDVPRCERPRDPVAFSRLTSLLKLLFCPPLV